MGSVLIIILQHTLTYNFRIRTKYIIDSSPIRIYDREQGNGMATKKHGTINA